MSDWFKAIAIIALLVISIMYGAAYRMSDEQITIIVDEKQTKYHDNDEKYLVHSTNGEVFEITDSVLFFRWDSSDTYFELEEGETYQCTVAGWRVPFLSMYRNIISIDAE